MPESKPFRVLSIDGGGVRGIIPATILAYLEKRCGASVSDLFDLIVGTSTGGIIALGLTAPDGRGRPTYRAKDLQEMYRSEAEAIFPGGGPKNLVSKLIGTRHPTDWFKRPAAVMRRPGQNVGAPLGGNPRFTGAPRYDKGGFDRVFALLGATPMKAALSDVIVTSYDMAFREPALVSSRPRSGYITFYEAARATSAGPTYFEPQLFNDGHRQRALVDGGVFLNNPAILGLGNGTRNMSANPVDVSGLGSDVTSINTNGTEACAVTTKGAVKCWGENFEGQLGIGMDSGPEQCTFSCSSLPVQVQGLTSGVTAVSLGGAVCALVSNGGIKRWGGNLAGQLGTGNDIVIATVPLDVVSTAKVVHGDASCDGSVDSVDAELILQYSAGFREPHFCESNADANQDGAVDPVDATLILQFTAGLLHSLPP